jgi:hypothetical protein
MVAFPTTPPAKNGAFRGLAAVTTVTTFGRVVGAEFIGALVQGLPDLPNGAPALALFASVLKRGADAVPPGYGDALGARVYTLARRTFWDHDVVEEAMLMLVTTAVRGRVYLTPGCPVEHAQRYVLAAVANAAKNVLRGRGRTRRGEVPFDLEPVRDERRMQYPDPRTLEEADRVVAAIDRRSESRLRSPREGRSVVFPKRTVGREAGLACFTGPGRQL